MSCYTVEQPSSHMTLCYHSSVVLSNLVVLFAEAARPNIGFKDLEFNHVNHEFQTWNREDDKELTRFLCR